MVSKGEQFLVTLPSKQAAEVVVGWNGRVLVMEAGPVNPTFTPMEAKLGLEEIAELVEKELRMQDRSALLAKGGGAWTGDSTKVRAVEQRKDDSATRPPPRRTAPPNRPSQP